MERLSSSLKHCRKQNADRIAGAGYVYIIQCENHSLYKIGVAANVESRRQLLQIGCPFELRTVEFSKCRDPYATEELLHEMVGKHRVRGEWFRLTDAQLLPVIDLIRSIPQW
jgi:hypothetical protein